MNKTNYYNKVVTTPCSKNCLQSLPCLDSNYVDNTYILGNSINFSVNKNDNEINADIIVHSRKSVRVWGQIKDCDGNTIPYAYVKLLKSTPNGLIGIAHTITDCEGFYQFDICVCQASCSYTIIAGKAATGYERVISTGLINTNCDAPPFSNCCNNN